MAKATWFCVDIECSGPVPGCFDMLSIGVAVVKPTATGFFIEDDVFYAEIKPTAPEVDPGAMKVNGLDLEALKRDGLPLARALEQLDAFVQARGLPGTEAVFVGHNAPFDWSFVRHAYHVTGRSCPFGYKALCTKALSVGVLGLHWLDTNKEILAERLDLPEVEAKKVHRADYDAWYQAHILARLLEAGNLLDPP